jgi:hypothetical protein
MAERMTLDFSTLLLSEDSPRLHSDSAMQRPIREWTRCVLREPAGRLTILHPPGGEVWRDVALRFARGELSGLQTVKSAPSNRVGRGEIAGVPGIYFFKWYTPTGTEDRLKQTFRGTRALRAALRGADLNDAGFHAPETVCVIEQRRGGIVTGCGLITLAIPDAPAVREWLNADAAFLSSHWKGTPATFPITGKRGLLKAFGEELARMHVAGIRHADARLRNILCRFDDGRWLFYWLDNEGNRRRSSRLYRRVIQNLVQVNMDRAGLTVADRLCFWRAYVAAQGWDRKHAREIRNKVAEATRARWSERGWL